MAFTPRCQIPGLAPEAERALGEIQSAIASELAQVEKRASSPRRRVTELVEEGAVIAKPGQVVRVQPGDEDVTVYLPETAANNAGEDIVVSFEGDGTAAGKVNVVSMSASCALPATTVLNSPGQYRYTSIGETSPKPGAGSPTPSTSAGGSWSGPPELTDADLPEMPGNSVKVNATSTTGEATDLVLPALSVLGRQSGNLVAITTTEFVPSGQRVYLKSGALGTPLGFSTISIGDLPTLADGQFYLQTTGTPSAAPSLTDLSGRAGAGLGFDGTPDYKFKIAANGVVDAMLRQSAGTSVIGRSAGSTGNVADITASSNDTLLARVSGSLGFTSLSIGMIPDGIITIAKLAGISANTVLGNNTAITTNPVEISVGTNSVLGRVAGNIVAAQLATGQIADDAVTDAKLANMIESTIKGRAIGAGTGDPTVLTGVQAGEIIRFGTKVDDSTSTGAIATYAIAEATCGIRFTGSAAATIHGATVPLLEGKQVYWFVTSGAAAVITFKDESATAGGITERFRTTKGADVVLSAKMGILTRYTQGRHTVIAGPMVVPDADYGDVTVSSGGTVWTIDGDAVDNTKLANMATPRLKGRTTSGTGDPEDLTLTNSTTVTWNTSTGGAISTERAALTGDVTASANSNATTIASDAVTDAKLRNSGALSVIGRSANSSGDPADISASAASDAVLRESGSVLGFGTIATGGIANNAVTDAKLRTSAALSVVGRSANSTGNVADISASAASDAVLRESGSVVGFGTIATGGIANDAVTDGKLRNSGALSVIGRSANSSGDPADISGTASSDAVLRVSGTTLGFGTVATAGIADAAVTDAKISNRSALSVFGRSANSSGVGADIAGSASSDAVLRVSGTTLGFGTVATAGIADDAVTNAKLANMAARTIKGRADSAGTGDPTDLTGAQVGAIIRFNTEIGDTTTTGTVATYALNTNTNSVTFNGVTNTINGFTAASEPGQLLVVQHIGAGSTTLVNNSTTASAAADRMRIATFGADVSALVLGATGRQIAVFLYFGSRWIYIAGDAPPVDAVQDAMLRNSGALSVIGRSANSSGDPADISATAASDAVLRESGSVLGFGTIATGGIASDAVTDAKLRNSGALSVIGRSANSSGDPADISGTASSDAVLRISGTTLGFGTVATAGITDAAVTLAKMANLSQSTIIGRAEGAGTGVPTALTPSEVTSIIDGEALFWTGNHRFGADLVANAAFMLATVASATIASRLDNFAAGQVTQSRFTCTGAQSISGIVPPTTSEECIMLVTNADDTDNLTLLHNNANSTNTNRFFLPGNTDRVLLPRASALLHYDVTDGRWHMVYGV